MDTGPSQKVAIIVAHPDDETLWAGGTILNNHSWQCFIACLCRKNDKDRAPKFGRVLNRLHAKGKMGDLDDSPEQKPLSEKKIEQAILKLLPSANFDLVITHSPNGEYTRHLRHEEVSKAVINLWDSGQITTGELWTFAYQDGNRAYYPEPIKNAAAYSILSGSIWNIKYDIITNIYGFDKNTWEAKTTPKAEAFWKFSSAADAKQWLDKGGAVL